MSVKVVVVIILSSGVVYPLNEGPVLVEGLLVPDDACDGKGGSVVVGKGSGGDSAERWRG